MGFLKNHHFCGWIKVSIRAVKAFGHRGVDVCRREVWGAQEYLGEGGLVLGEAVPGGLVRVGGRDRVSVPHFHALISHTQPQDKAYRGPGEGLLSTCPILWSDVSSWRRCCGLGTPLRGQGQAWGAPGGLREHLLPAALGCASPPLPIGAAWGPVLTWGGLGDRPNLVSGCQGEGFAWARRCLGTGDARQGACWCRSNHGSAAAPRLWWLLGGQVRLSRESRDQHIPAWAGLGEG